MQKVLEKVEIPVEMIPVYTLSGKKTIIKLSDFAYGEWLIFKNNELVYYINLFDSYFSQLKKKIESKEITIEEFINSINATISETFSLNQKFWGMRVNWGVEYGKIEVYKFPFT